MKQWISIPASLATLKCIVLVEEQVSVCYKVEGWALWHMPEIPSMVEVAVGRFKSILDYVVKFQVSIGSIAHSKLT